MSDTPNTGIPYVPEGTLDPAAGLNLALNVIDALLQTAVQDMDQTAPPGSPADGDLHIVASPATGAWAGHENDLARYVAEGTFWQFFTAGFQVHLVVNLADLALYRFDLTSSPGAWGLVAGLGDASSNDITYARKNGAWVSIAAPVVSSSASNIDADETNAGNYTRFSHAAPTYTFDDGEAFVVGAEYHGRYVGSGTLTITAAGTMTINPPAAGTLVIPPDGTFTIKIVAADEADLFGITVAA